MLRIPSFPLIPPRLFVLVSLCLLGYTISAQTLGTLTGRITEGASGKPLLGATVALRATQQGMVTEQDGSYRITRISPGEVQVAVSYFGYTTIDTVVSVPSGSEVVLNVVMTSMVYEGEVVEIVGQRKGQLDAINEQLSANRIVNVVSAEKLQELPDANAAESIGRLPGVSLKRSSGEASGVVIRGLSPKYSNITLGGIKIMSTNAQDRGVDLSIITGENLGGIEVSKSLRADMDADALGGTINLRVQPALEGFRYNVLTEGGYNQLGNSFNNYRFSGRASNRFFDNKLGVSVTGKIEQKDIPSDIFSGSYSNPIFEQEIGPDGELVDLGFFLRTQGATLEDRGTLRQRQAASVVLDYETGPWSVRFLNIWNRKVDEVVSRRLFSNFTDNTNPFVTTLNVFEEDAQLFSSAVQNEFQLGPTELRLNLAYAQANTQTPGTSYAFIEENLSGAGVPLASLRYAQPDTLLDRYGQTDPTQNFLQSWDRNTYELTNRSYDVRLDYDVPFRLGDWLTGTLTVGGKVHRLERNSDDSTRYVDFQFGEGATSRSLFAEAFPWVNSETGALRGMRATSLVDPTYDPGNFLDGRYQLYWSPDADLMVAMQDTFFNLYQDQGRYFLRGIQSYIRDYTAIEDQVAGYAMTELNIGPKLMLLPGIRYEREHTTYTAFHIIEATNPEGINGTPDSVTVERENIYWFPSINAKYKASKLVQLQGAVYRSMTRPDFRQLSPQNTYRLNPGSFFDSNNPFLRPALAWNYDLGVSLFSRKLGLLSINGFYKQIDDLIFLLTNYQPVDGREIVNTPDDFLDILPPRSYYDTTYLQAGAFTNTPINNTERATFFGIEAGWQTSFWYLPGALSGLVLDVNATIIRSETAYPYFEEVIVGADTVFGEPVPRYGQGYATRPGPVVDQPRAVINVILGWDYKGFSSRISYRYQDQVLQVQDSRFGLKDSYYDNFTFVDLSLKQEINKHLSVYLNATNLTNHIDDFFFGEREDIPRLPTSANSFGRRIQLGVRLRY